MRLFFLIILLLGINHQLNAQEAVIPPSPEAASLGSYANNPVSLFTGTPEINIPITAVRIKDYSLPVFLSYYAKGIQVEQIASSVGLGWALSAGGVITRSVVNFPDDISAIIGINKYKGYLMDDNATKVHDFDPNTPPGEFINKYIDTEPDIYYFNIGGKTGKFVIDKDKNVCLLTYSNLKAKSYFNSDGSINYFTITDENGVKYEFKDKETSKTTVTNKYINFMFTKILLNVSSSFSYTSSWYLSKITTIGGQEILFTYSGFNISYDLRVQEEANYCNDDNCVGKSDLISLKQDIQTKSISTISTSIQTIEFGYATAEREDLPGSKSLSTITVYSEPGKVAVHDYKFNYAYFISKGIEGASTADKPKYKRLKLESVQKGSGNGNYLPSTSFVYNYVESGENEIRLPNRWSCEQDIWGFYSANGATTLIPKTYVYPGRIDYIRAIPDPYYELESYTLPGANRVPDQSGKYTSANILTQINYPTGGYEKYTYEPNDYLLGFPSVGDSYKGCGLRIKKIEKYDGINHSNDNVKQYYYTDSKNLGRSSGALFYMPNFGYVNFIDEDDETFLYDDCYAIYYHKDASENYDLRQMFFQNVVKRFSINIASLGATSNLIGYREVKVKENSGNGYIIYRFNTPGEYQTPTDNPDVNCLYNNSCDGLYVNTEVHSESYSEINCENKPQFTYEPFWDYKLRNEYPYPPHPSYDWNRGLLTSKSVYNENGSLIESEENIYGVFTQNNEDINTKKVYGIKIGVVYLPIKYRNTTNFECIMLSSPLMYAKYEFFTRCSKVLSSSTTTLYDLNDNTKSISTTKSYTYNNFGQIIQVTQVQSDGSTAITKYKYPTDFYPISDILCPKADDRMTKALEEMKDKNMLATPVETIITKDGNIIDGNLNLYRYYYDNFLVLPANQCKLEIQKPVPDFVNSYIERQTVNILGIDRTCDKKFHFDARYKINSTFDSFDSYGSILQYHKENGVNVSYIWGYNNTYPIAEAQNAAWDEIFFNGFEENTDANSNTDSRSGLYSYKVAPDQFSPGHDFGVWDDSKSGGYKLSAWVKAPVYNGSNQACLIIEVRDGNNFNNMLKWYANYININSNWQYFETPALDLKSIATANPGKKLRVRCYVLNNAGNDLLVDDIRFQPSNSKMATYTYNPLIGITSATDNNNYTTFYYYDSFGRLYQVKDHKGNILKQHEYHYKE